MIYRENTPSGQFVAASTVGVDFKAFLPHPLPPNPAVDMNHLAGLCSEADRALAELKGMSSILPDEALLLYSYVRKEALLSAQIEGTQSTFFDLLLYENDRTSKISLDDVQEVSSYVRAMYHGLKRIRVDNFPICLRLMREMHEILLSNNRGNDKAPGEFRRSQNWIGGRTPAEASFVPPPASEVVNCMAELETFLHSKSPNMPLLVKAALMHVQFETIHPFLDGNGRLGRLLVTLLLCSEGALTEPLLYLSLYFKFNRSDYYDRLLAVSTRSAWEDWVRFFLEGVREVSTQAIAATKEISALFDADRKRIEELKRPAYSVLRVYDAFRKIPLLDVSMAGKEAKIPLVTVHRALKHLQALDVVREVSGKKRGRIFVYHAYMKILEQGTELLPGQGRDS